jgi:hypothetical protein
MGATASTSRGDMSDEQVMTEIENRKGMVDKSLTQNLTNISDLLVQYGKNDTEAIVDKIRSMEEFKGKIPDNILTKASNAHKSILDSIDSSLSPDDKKKKLETDGGVADQIKKYVDKDMDEKMKGYLENPFIKNDPIVQKSMTDVTTSIKTIRGKYKYFEYKYIQMNMFLILFTQHIHTTVSKFINETAAFYEAREKYHLVLIHNVIKIFQEQLGDETKNFADLDTTQFSAAIKELATSVMDSIGKQKQLAETMKQQSLSEILKFLMDREKDFATNIVKSVDDYKREHALTAGPNIPYSTPTARVGSNIPYGTSTSPGLTRSKSMTGGFIRANSMLPQDFFKI